mmetsp:Transcript_31560/g.92528  ORF Transcript_31560/g.92528 Transcript_31560/m.92528 type:complete len:205 (+) Transcript_31560:1643-2257(+)
MPKRRLQRRRPRRLPPRRPLPIPPPRLVKARARRKRKEAPSLPRQERSHLAPTLVMSPSQAKTAEHLLSPSCRLVDGIPRIVRRASRPHVEPPITTRGWPKNGKQLRRRKRRQKARSWCKQQQQQRSYRTWERRKWKWKRKRRRMREVVARRMSMPLPAKDMPPMRVKLSRPSERIDPNSIQHMPLDVHAREADALTVHSVIDG